MYQNNQIPTNAKKRPSVNQSPIQTHAQYLASQLAKMGVTHVFCLIGDTNLDFVGALLEQGIQLVHGRHEQGVAAMADGYARFCRKNTPAVCTVTQGAGLTNTTTSLLTAMNAGSGVLLVVGDTPINTDEQQFDQEHFCQIASHNAATITSPKTAATDIQKILTTLASGHGVGVINMHTALWKEPIAKAQDLVYHATKPLLPQDVHLKRAAAAIRASARPAILAGRGAVRSQANKAVARLAEILGTPIVTTVPALGFASGHRLNVGTAGTFGDGTGSDALQQSDCIIAIGSRMSHWTLDAGTAIHNKPVIRINHHAHAGGAGEYLSLIGDAARTVSAVTDHLSDIRRTPWFRVSPKKITFNNTPGALDPRFVLHQLTRLLPTQRTVVLDGGQHVIFSIRTLQMACNTDFAWTSDFGAIGQGLGTAIGAAFARPGQRITLITGDGGFMMNISELDTVARYKLPITIVILNDQGFGQERASLITRGIPDTIADYPTPDLPTLAAAHGISGHTIATTEQLNNVESLIAGTDGPLLLDIRTSRDIRSDFLKRVTQHRQAARQLRL